VPMLGEHTTQILAEVLGLRGEEIRELHAEGVVTGHDTGPGADDGLGRRAADGGNAS
jgi:hypothetical protein